MVANYEVVRSRIRADLHDLAYRLEGHPEITDDIPHDQIAIHVLGFGVFNDPPQGEVITVYIR